MLYTIIRNAKAGDAVCFDWKVVTQGLPVGGEYGSISIDKLVFRINQAIVEQISGTTNWENCAYIIPQDGDYYFSWDFIAYDESEVVNAVTSWVDNVSYVEDYVPPVAPGDPLSSMRQSTHPAKTGALSTTMFILGLLSPTAAAAACAAILQVCA